MRCGLRQFRWSGDLRMIAGSARRFATLAWLVCVSGVPCAAPGAQRELDLVLQRTPDPQNGAKLYETCAACHGNQGEGVSDGSVPAIGGQLFSFVAKQLVDFRNGVRSDPRMQHFADSRHLAYSQYIADVAAYVSTLRVAAPQQQESSRASARGAMLYARSCERCHGAVGEGNEGELVPRVAGQHFDYMQGQLQRSAQSRPDMTNAHARVLGSLSKDELVAVTHYLANLM
jgi:cytochrome c553